MQLQAWLGEEYEVVNFGVSATTALYEGLYPYVETERYRQSLEYNPDVVIIKLGAVRSTNYLYINPIVAMITSYFVLNEHITSLAIIGTALILTGMYLAQRQRR